MIEWGCSIHPTGKARVPQKRAYGLENFSYFTVCLTPLSSMEDPDSELACQHAPHIDSLQHGGAGSWNKLYSRANGQGECDGRQQSPVDIVR